jgi:hypothetical protein
MSCLHLASIMALAALVTSTTSYAQDAPHLETIPETLARVGESLTSRPSIPSGIADMAEILRQTELIVRGSIGSPTKAYLSKDQRDIYTDYPLIKTIVLFDSTVQSFRTPVLGSEVTVTVLGGSIQRAVPGPPFRERLLTFTLIPKALPELPTGAEGLFLLKRIDGKYQPVGYFFGAFEISGDRITRPFTQAHGFADEYRGAPASATAQRWVTTVARHHHARK